MARAVAVVFLVDVLGAGGHAQDKNVGVRLPTWPGATLETGRGVTQITLADINGDGFLDIVAAICGEHLASKSLLFLSGKGKFAKPAWSSQPNGAWMNAAVGDLDADGDLDLVLVNYDPRDEGEEHAPAAVAYRNTRGTFEEKPFWSPDDWPGNQPDHAVVGDFNGDAFTDVIVCGMQGVLQLYRGGKDGVERTAAWKGELGGSPSRIEWVDIDLDGRRDLVCAGWGATTLMVLKGTASWFEEKPSQSYANRRYDQGLAVGDVNGDGYLDVAIGSITGRNGDGRIRMYSNGKGTIAREPSWTSDDLDANSDELIFADMDRDGDLDLVAVACEHSGVYENRGGVLSTQPVWRARIEEGGGCGRVADLDKNGYSDLIVSGKDRVQIYYGGPDVPVAKADPFPAPPKLDPLTAADVRPAMDPWIDARLEAYRRAGSAEERGGALVEMKSRAAEVLGAIALLDAVEEPAGLREALRADADTQGRLLVSKLGDESADEREDAARRLARCGEAARPWLKEAALSSDAEIRARAKTVTEAIDKARWDRIVAVAAAGFVFARITPRLQARYKLSSTEGVLVLRVPEHAREAWGMGNLREGDVLLGIGSYMTDGETVEAATDAMGLLALLATYPESQMHEGRKIERRSGAPLPMGYRMKCGPMHPLDVGTVRKGRIRFAGDHWDAIKKAHANPEGWKPGR